MSDDTWDPAIRALLDHMVKVEASDLYYLTGTVQDAHLVVPAVREPVYLVLGMTTGNTIRVKPQNLIAGLPLRTAGMM